jgi:NAD(P)-dependent dehydrogenase (short-subunit alcohol dehydrogenase family)
MGKLDGKIALITGGTTGIGLATAKLFLKEGAQVVVTGRSAENIAAAQKELGAGALAVQSDTSKLADIKKLMEQIRTKYGRIDMLFANAGVGKFSPLEQVDEAFYDNLFAVNVKGLYFTVQQAAPLIPDGGAILLNASVASQKGFPGSSVYAATKAAVRSFGRTLAAELAPRRVRVNTISPGPVDTPIFKNGGFSPEDAAKILQEFAQGVPLKRHAEPQEIAQAALFLLSSDASYVVGAELFVDGGIVAV